MADEQTAEINEAPSEKPPKMKAASKAAPTKKAPKKKAPNSKAPKKLPKKKADKKGTTRKRTPRPYPVVAFKQATSIGEAIHKFAAGEKIRRLTLLEKLSLTATSSSTMMLITNSGKYGITTGSYSAEFLELTLLGKIACDPSASPRAKLDARFKLAIDGIVPFKLLYDSGVSKKLVAREVMFDLLDAAEIAVDDNAECVDIFITNLQELGLLRTIGGSETIIPIQQALEETGEAPLPPTGPNVIEGATTSAGTTDWDKICFYVTPIGDPDTPVRQHSDLFKSSIVEPAMEELGLVVVRADEVGTPGMIASSIMEHIKRCKLVVADLSMLNPNVFYEIALRHACRLPIVQIMSATEKIPFDISQVNTMSIDNSSLYSFVPKIETYKSELATLARNAIKDPTKISNPITVFYPGYWDK